MMARTTGITLFCLMVVFGSSVATAPTASAALPEFIELNGAFPYPLTGHGVAAAVFEHPNGEKITCKSSSLSGEIANVKKTKKVKITFEECTESVTGGECQTNPAEKGKIVTRELEGLLGYVEKATTKVGLDLDAVAQPFAIAECSGVPVEFKGDVVGELEPPNVPTKLYKLVLKQTAGVQRWKKLEGVGESVLEVSIACGARETIGLEVTEEIKVEKESKINA